MKVLFLTQTTACGPASRYRVYRLVPWLQKLGIEAEISPAITEERYQQIYRENGGVGNKLLALGRGWQRRQTDLARLEPYDAVFVQKGFLPGGYSGFELAIAKRKPLVFDLDDAIWLPRVGGNPLLRVLHRESRVQAVLRAAAAVIAGNEFLAAYARRFNPNVTVVPSAIDIGRYPEPTVHHSAAPTIGWIGSRTTLAYLKALAPVFHKLEMIPKVIAAGDPSHLGFPVDFVEWNAETETRELQSLDIGISPLPDTPWEQGKCGTKLLQYMACGLPVVASPVGVNACYVRDGVNGFHARTTGEWCDRLARLLTDADLRQQMGHAGRRRTEQEFTIEQAAARVAGVLQACIQRTKSGV